MTEPPPKKAPLKKARRASIDLSQLRGICSLTGHKARSSRACLPSTEGSTDSVYIFFLRKFKPCRTKTFVGNSYCFFKIPSKRRATALLAVAKRMPTAPFIPKMIDPPIRNKQDASIFMATSASLEASYWHNSFFTSSANDMGIPSH